MRAATHAVATLAALVAAGVLGLAPGLCADGPAPLPDDVTSSSGHPPLVPTERLADDAARAAWIERTTAAARASADGRRAAELLAGAAAVAVDIQDGRALALALGTEARARIAPADPLTGHLLLDGFELCVALDRYEQALPLAREIAWWQGQPAPLDASTPDLERRRHAQQRIVRGYPTAAVRLFEQQGDLASAASWASYAARIAPEDTRIAASARWERAAVLLQRAGQPKAARAAAAQAAERADEPETQARLAFWRLHLDHGLLAPDGTLRPTHRPLGPTYLDDLEGVLRGLAGNPRVGPFLLSAASSALAAGSYEQALVLYRKALADPVLTQAAWHQDGLWGGLLPAVTAAAALGRFDEAEELLSMVERIAGERVPEAEPLRVRIKLARDGAAARASAPPPPPPPTPPEEPVPSSRARPPGELLLPDAAREQPPERGAAAAPEPEARAGPWPWLLGGGLGLVLLLLVAVGRRR